MKRRGTICAVLTLLVAAAGVATAQEAQGPAPKAVVVKAIQDLGIVPKGDKVDTYFEIRNDGDADLVIHEARPSCGCTVADFDKTIAPGETGKVHASIDSTNLNGANRKTVTAYTNDPSNAAITLTIQSDVRPYVSVVPGYARFNVVQLEKLGSVAQTIWPEDGNDFKILSAEAPVPHLSVSYREATAEEKHEKGKGRQWRVEIGLADDAPVGALSHYVTVTTDHPKQKTVKIPVSGFVRPIVAVTPPIADFREVKIEEPLKTNMVVKTYATELIHMTGVESSVEQIKAEVVPVEEGRNYRLSIVISPDMPKGPFSGVLKIKTDSSKQPVVEVLLKGTVI